MTGSYVCLSSSQIPDHSLTSCLLYIDGEDSAPHHRCKFMCSSCQHTLRIKVVCNLESNEVTATEGLLRPPPLGGVQPLGGCAVKEGHPSVSQTFHANTRKHTPTHAHTYTHIPARRQAQRAHTSLHTTRTRQWCQDHGEVQPSSIPSTSLDSGR